MVLHGEDDVSVLMELDNGLGQLHYHHWRYPELTVGYCENGKLVLRTVDYFP